MFAARLPVGKISAALLTASVLCAPLTQPVTAQSKTPTQAPEFLFVQTANDIAYTDGVLAPQESLAGDPLLLGSPETDCGSRRNDVFLQKWTEGKNSFKSDPSNAVAYDVKTLQGRASRGRD